MISREDAGSETSSDVMVLLFGQTDMEAYAEGETVWE
jgi:hypothetical protein